MKHRLVYGAFLTCVAMGISLSIAYATGYHRSSHRGASYGHTAPTPAALSQHMAPVLNHGGDGVVGAIYTAPHIGFQVSHLPIAMPIKAIAQDVGAWGIDLGRFDDLPTSHKALQTARDDSAAHLEDTQQVILPLPNTEGFGAQAPVAEKVHYRVALLGLNAPEAITACNSLRHHGIHCTVLSPGL